MLRATWWTRLAVVAMCCCGASQLAAEPARRPNVLLILADDQRPDTIHALGNPIIDTPNLDKLAAGGVSFSRAVCAFPICTYSRAEIVCGVNSFRNKLVGKVAGPKPKLTLWAEAMRAAGYQTWYSGKWHLGGRPITRGYVESQGLFASGGQKFMKPAVDWKGFPVTGYSGWVFQNDAGQMFPELGVGLTTETSRRIADGAISLIRRRSEQPFFLHVNFTSPHDPLLMPPELAGKYDPDKMPLPGNFLPQHPFDHGNFHGRDEEVFSFPRTEKQTRGELACYYALISQMDAEIGRILAALDETGQRENTIIIFTSDHGLAIGSHGLRGKQNMYEHTVNVPLLVSGPGIGRGRRSAAQLYLRDLYPTVCELTGVPIPSSVESRSMASVLRGDSEAGHDEVFCYFMDVQRMIRTDHWKLAHYPKIDRYQLFDLAADPLEMHDRAADPAHATKLAELQGRLRSAQQAAGDPLADATR